MALRNAGTLIKRKYFPLQLKLNHGMHRTSCRVLPCLDVQERQRLALTVHLRKSNTVFLCNAKKSSTFSRGIDSVTSKHVCSTTCERLHAPGYKHQASVSFTSYPNSDNGHMLDANIKPAVGYENLNSYEESFIEKLQNCNSVDEILTHVELAMQQNSLPLTCISSVFSKYQKQLYEAISLPSPEAKASVKKNHMIWNFCVDEVLGPYFSDFRFQNLICYSELVMKDIPVDDCVHILHSLDFLFISKHKSGLVLKLLDKCSEHLENLDLKQLAVFSSSLKSFSENTHLFGRVANALKIWLGTHSACDIDLSILRLLYHNIRHVASNDLFELGAEAIIAKLSNDPSGVTISMIHEVSSLARISRFECYQTLVNGMLNLHPQCFNFDFTSDNLTFNSITEDICPHPLLNRWRAYCLSELKKAESLPVKDVVKLCLHVAKIPGSVFKDKLDVFVQCVEESDNFLLFQLICCHMKTDFEALPEGQRLLSAFGRRIKRLLSTLDEDQLKDLLRKHDFRFFNMLFKFRNKFASSSGRPTGDAHRALHSHLQIEPCVWEKSSLKTELVILYICQTLESGFLRSSDELSALAKSMKKLRLDHMMNLYKKLEVISSLKSMSPAAREQARYLKKELHEVFEDKLSRQSSLTWTSNKILSVPEVYRYWHQDRKGLYGQLVENLPRFLRDSDEKSYQQVLKILNLGAEIFSPYQKDTFEILTSFVVSSPKLLVNPGIHLLKVLAYSGYQPTAFEEFNLWTLKFVTELVEKKLMSNATLVQLAYHLSLLGIFHDELLLKIFTMDFMTELDQELDEALCSAPKKVKHDLALLNRSVAIECPHLEVRWFCKSFLLKVDRSDSSYVVNKVFDSVCRISGDPSYILRPAESLYGHQIHLMIYFDPSSGLVRPKDIQNTQPMPDIKKIAIMCLEAYHFCHNTDIMTGRFQSDIQHLEMLGYTVVLLHHKELSSMGVQDKESLDEYVMTKINSSAGFDVFTKFEQP